MTHTPVPWIMSDIGDYSDFDGNSRVILGDDRRLAVIQTDGGEETEANAQLMLKSPNMYGLLQAMVTANNNGDDLAPYLLDAERLINEIGDV